MNVLLQKEFYESLRIILCHYSDLRLVGVAVLLEPSEDGRTGCGA
jgi:hypothetical protein